MIRFIEASPTAKETAITIAVLFYFAERASLTHCVKRKTFPRLSLPRRFAEVANARNVRYRSLTVFYLPQPSISRLHTLAVSHSTNHWQCRTFLQMCWISCHFLLARLKGPRPKHASGRSVPSIIVDRSRRDAHAVSYLCSPTAVVWESKGARDIHRALAQLGVAGAGDVLNSSRLVQRIATHAGCRWSCRLHAVLQCTI